MYTDIRNTTVTTSNTCIYPNIHNSCKHTTINTPTQSKGPLYNSSTSNSSCMDTQICRNNTSTSTNSPTHNV
jgi:hypothetical protein